MSTCCLVLTAYEGCAGLATFQPGQLDDEVSPPSFWKVRRDVEVFSVLGAEAAEHGLLERSALFAQFAM